MATDSPTDSTNIPIRRSTDPARRQRRVRSNAESVPTKFQLQRRKDNQLIKRAKKQERKRNDAFDPAVLERIARPLIEREYALRQDQLQQLAEQEELEEQEQQAEAERQEEEDRQQPYNRGPIERYQRQTSDSPGARFIKDRLAKKGQEAADRAVKEAGKKVAQQAAKRLASQVTRQALAAGARALLANPYVLAALAIIAVIILLIILIFAVAFGMSGMSAQANGTTPTIPINNQSTTDMSALEKTLSGSLATKADVENLIKEVQRLKSELASNSAAIALLSDIEAAAETLLEQFEDPAVKKEQTALIQEKVEQLRKVLRPTPELGPNGVILDIPGIGEGQQGHCGIASILMVIKHSAPSWNNPAYYNAATNSTQKGLNPFACVSEATINEEIRLAGGSKTDWTRGYNSEDKDTLLRYVQQSLAGGDPAVIFLGPGGFYPGQHIIVIVGYDPSNDSYYVNNPKPPGRDDSRAKAIGQGSVDLKVNHGSASIGSPPLTGQHLKQYMGVGYLSSLIIRKAYKQ